MEEQIVVLRRLWTEPFVNFEGRFHMLHGVGLHQLPPQPIPVWIGCAPQELLLRRVARVADGWLPQVDPAEPLTRLRGYLREAGRDPVGFGVTWRLVAGPGGPESWVETVRQLETVGVTDVTINAPPDVSGASSLQRIIEARQALAAAGY
jgi:Luciferase-like monooxygenase